MILDKKKTVRPRWLKADINSFYDTIEFIEVNSPTLNELGDYLKVGQPKARALVEYFMMFGIVKGVKSKYYLTDIYKDIKKLFKPKEIVEIMFYCFVQNYDWMFWFVTDYCFNQLNMGINETSLESIKFEIPNFKRNYHSNVEESTIKSQINKELSILLKKQGSNNYPLSMLNIFIYEGETIVINRYNDISIRALLLIFYVAWNKFFKGLSNLRIDEVVNNPVFPFRTFLIDDNKVAQLLVELERLNIIKIIDVADIKNISLNPSITYKDLISIMGE